MSPQSQDIATVGHTPNRFAKYLANGLDLCRKIAGLDLAGQPLYIVPQSLIADSFGKAEACYEYTTPNLDLYLQKHIDDWHGRGPCMVINDLAIDEDQDPDFHEELALNHIIHELAHILDRPLPAPNIKIKPAKIKFESLVVAQATRKGSSAPVTFGHEYSFIRIAIHLVERANRLGHDIRHAGVIHCHHYGLLPIHRYVESLRPEINAFSNCRLRNLAMTQPPIQFLELWQSDTQSQGGTL